MRITGLVLPLLLVAIVNARDPEVSSSAVSEAVEQLTGHRAHMTNEVRFVVGSPFAGPAVTLRLVRDDTASATEAGLVAIKLLESAPAGSVVVAVLEGDKEFAVFGSTFAALAQSRKLAGFVVDGSVRDVSELRRLAFPTFARGTAPGSAGGHYRVAGTNVAVLCGGIEVTPGDVVVADEDGVAVAPKERYAEVMPVAKKWQSDKQALLPLIARYGSYLKAMQERDAIQRRRP